jgi:virulence-associated protein VapD
MKTNIEMAREAGFVENQGNIYGGHLELEAFAALVRADEREACLNWCAACATDDGTAQKIDAAIRAMGNT